LNVDAAIVFETPVTFQYADYLGGAASVNRKIVIQIRLPKFIPFE
jgi:hypothetical protein